MIHLSVGEVDNFLLWFGLLFRVEICPLLWMLMRTNKRFNQDNDDFLKYNYLIIVYRGLYKPVAVVACLS